MQTTATPNIDILKIDNQPLVNPQHQKQLLKDYGLRYLVLQLLNLIEASQILLFGGAITIALTSFLMDMHLLFFYRYDQEFFTWLTQQPWFWSIFNIVPGVTTQLDNNDFLIIFLKFSFFSYIITNLLRFIFKRDFSFTLRRQYKYIFIPTCIYFLAFILFLSFPLDTIIKEAKFDRSFHIIGLFMFVISFIPSSLVISYMGYLKKNLY